MSEEQAAAELADLEERRKAHKVRIRSSQVKKARRRRMMLDLRAAGLSHDEIAEQMTQMGEKITGTGVGRSLQRHLRQMAEQDQTAIEELRSMELYRIGAAMQVLWPKVKEGNLKAMREWRAFIDQRARLQGTYAATKHEVYGEVNHVLDPGDRAEIERLEEAFVTAAYEEVTDAVVLDAPALPSGEDGFSPAPPADPGA